MLPLVHRLSQSEAMGLAPGNMLLPFGLLVGACLGGNITPIGASANVVAYGMLNKTGDRETTFVDFARIGLPFTVAAVLGGAAFLWLVWM
jgi:Na+/H+ antiporter NhaD/arsenite permease-like protein